MDKSGLVVGELIGSGRGRIRPSRFGGSDKGVDLASDERRTKASSERIWAKPRASVRRRQQMSVERRRRPNVNSDLGPKFEID
ncbi:hypothetical protein NL676_002738 [Syzygium grande]|nr:hypothetical protein NL676_002738 [Syzygium grande]